MNSLVPTTSLVPPLSSSRRGTRRLIHSMPASPACRCRFAASAASRTKDLCAASAAVAVHHHAWQCRRRSFVRAEGASSASPVASRAWRCSAERLLSTVRPSTSCTDTIASSLAGASGGGERECAWGGRERTVTDAPLSRRHRRHGSPPSPPGQMGRAHTEIGERGEDNADHIVSPSRVPRRKIVIIVRAPAPARPSGCRSARRESSPLLARPASATLGPGVNLLGRISVRVIARCSSRAPGVRGHHKARWAALRRRNRHAPSSGRAPYGSRRIRVGHRHYVPTSARGARTGQ